jgi:hypothetical protein
MQNIARIARSEAEKSTIALCSKNGHEHTFASREVSESSPPLAGCLGTDFRGNLDTRMHRQQRFRFGEHLFASVEYKVDRRVIGAVRDGMKQTVPQSLIIDTRTHPLLENIANDTDDDHPTHKDEQRNQSRYAQDFRNRGDNDVVDEDPKKPTKQISRKSTAGDRKIYLHLVSRTKEFVGYSRQPPQGLV